MAGNTALAFFVEPPTPLSLSHTFGILDNFLRNLNVGCCDGYRFAEGNQVYAG